MPDTLEYRRSRGVVTWKPHVLDVIIAWGMLIMLVGVPVGVFISWEMGGYSGTQLLMVVAVAFLTGCLVIGVIVGIGLFLWGIAVLRVRTMMKEIAAPMPQLRQLPFNRAWQVSVDDTRTPAHWMDETSRRAGVSEPERKA